MGAASVCEGRAGKAGMSTGWKGGVSVMGPSISKVDTCLGCRDLWQAKETLLPTLRRSLEDRSCGVG